MTDHPDTSFAPGCFGRALTFRPDTAECRTCPFAGQCEPLSIARTERFRAELGIKAPRSRKRDEKAEDGTTALTATLPVKVVDLIERIDRAGIRVTESLAKGENPFGKRSVGFMRVVCHVLMKSPNGVNRAFLCSCMERHLGWQKATAVAHAAQAAQVLVALGAATELNGTIKLKGTR